MKIVIIPFVDEMAVAAIDGKKCKTTRGERYGEEGDVFEIEDPRDGMIHGFVIKKIFKDKLQHIAAEYYKDEGFDNPMAFVHIWIKLHPRKGWEPEAEKFVHCFEKVRE